MTPGTVVNELYGARGHADSNVIIGHPSGTITVEAKVHDENGRCVADRATFGRTVRPIMRGEALVCRAAAERFVSAIRFIRAYLA